MDENQPTQEMPKYKCHKEVHALKIAAINGEVITPQDKGYGEFTVSAAFIEKHAPKPGGYYVVYEDGYVSFSPAEAFEAGYTGIER